ncbi:nucleoside hydrolase [Punctularia strigosozonata HHB-11173 SS5]|uniref:nucleoside hydrolase n=1 Tax=Punctularia strigosozonata (strain HHB-11173) TaxID=741275 RepID=UPI0004416746|nr:nucleoside hydrolase [Punctularia strigosozonata HHB-11173 SS5]EIN10500.1 nucleoside hydrolase [Punctularia strigosozonata HHB-11173 SS5]
MSTTEKYVWLDCDPGHDDATAILLALHCPNIRLLGVSTVHGNASAENTMRNAARCLHAFAAPPSIRVYPGATKPLLRQAKHDPGTFIMLHIIDRYGSNITAEIHGADGLGGVEGLPSAESDAVQARLGNDEPVRALDAMSKIIRETWDSGKGVKVVVVSTGPMTNIALFVSVYPELVDAVEEFVFMGGGIGVGNRSAVAEYNILCDPEAVQIVLDTPVKKCMVPLNVTHTAIVTRDIHSNILSPGNVLASDTAPLPPPATPLRHTISTLISFFAESYRSTFGFVRGPPLHDALTIAYVSRPELFACMRYRVDVELGGSYCAGQTVADVWNYRQCDDSWGPSGKNCLIAETMDVPGFFELFLDGLAKCDVESPLNKSI